MSDPHRRIESVGHPCTARAWGFSSEPDGHSLPSPFIPWTANAEHLTEAGCILWCIGPAWQSRGQGAFRRRARTGESVVLLQPRSSKGG